MAEPDNTTLQSFYYRDNFLRLCTTVEAQYGDMLCGDQQSLLLRFKELSFTAQCLFIRLVSRTGPWFRESKLSYEELGALQGPMDALLQQSLAVQASALTLAELAKLYTHRELQEMFANTLVQQRYPDKAALLLEIEQLQLHEQHMLNTAQAFDGARIIAPVDVELVQQLQILFFGNRHQSLTEFVLQDLGVTRYYPYVLDRSQRLFPNRAAFDEYLACAQLTDRYHEIVETGDLEQLPALATDMLATTISYPSSEGRWHRLCNNLGRDLERQLEWELALKLYERSKRHPARERSARIMEGVKDWRAAAALCNDIITEPWSEDEREAASRILPRVMRKLGGVSVARQSDDFHHIEIVLGAGTGPVEQQTALHLSADWESVHYVENSLMNTLFGLAFWEQIFAPVPGVFHHPYQSVPADMYERTFRETRQAVIDSRLAELASGDLPAILLAAYQQYNGYQCRWVDWRSIDAALLQAVTRVMPAAHLLAIWERMLFDPRENRRGFPDLIALGDTQGHYALVEVKGPGDALQESQKRWLRFFKDAQIPAQVAWVQWHAD